MLYSYDITGENISIRTDTGPIVIINSNKTTVSRTASGVQDSRTRTCTIRNRHYGPGWIYYPREGVFKTNFKI